MSKNFFEQLSQQFSQQLSTEDKKDIINTANKILAEMFGIDSDDIKYNESDDISGDKNNFVIKKIINSEKPETNEVEENKKDTCKNCSCNPIEEIDNTENEDHIFNIDYTDIYNTLKHIFDDAIFTNNAENKTNETNTENTVNNKKETEKKPENTTNKNNVKARLLTEATQKTKEEYDLEIGNMLVNNISDILEDTKVKRYKIYKKTDKNPAAAEIILNGQTKYIKDNINILKYVEDTLKTKYDFNSVYIHCSEPVKDFISITIYIILD